MPHIPRAGLPGTPEDALAAALEAPIPQFTGTLVELDVRDDLRNGREPFGRIMAAVQELSPGQILHLRATFQPVPLFHVLARQGFDHQVVAHAPDDWSVWFHRAGDAPSGATQREARARTPETMPEYGDSSPAPRRPAGASSAMAASEIVLDVRGLEPPEPMVRTLEALERLPDGAVLVQRNDRVPQFLIPILAERGFTHEASTGDDGSVTVRITRSS